MHSFKWNIDMNLLETQILKDIGVVLNLTPAADLVVKHRLIKIGWVQLKIHWELYNMFLNRIRLFFLARLLLIVALYQQCRPAYMHLWAPGPRAKKQ